MERAKTVQPITGDEVTIIAHVRSPVRVYVYYPKGVGGGARSNNNNPHLEPGDLGNHTSLTYHMM